MAILAAFVGAFFGGLAAYFVARWQRRSDQASARQATVATAIGQLGAAIAELRWEAARLSGVPDDEKYEESRKLAPLRGRMIAAHTAIYAASDDETLIHRSRAITYDGLNLLDLGGAIPFDPATYEVVRSVVERTFRDLRQRARSLAGLGMLEGEPTNDTSEDLEGESDPVIW